MLDMKHQSPQFKEIMIMIGWFAGILLIGGLLWYFSQNFREQRMIKTVNAVLMEQNDVRRLQSSLDNHSEDGKTLQNYKRFSVLDTAGSAVVITLYDNGISSVIAAFLSADGIVQDIIPLDNHSAQEIKRIGDTKLKMYRARIEEKERQIRSEQ